MNGREKKPVGKIGGNKINGNVDSKEVKSKIKYITPVSGDIGPLTTVFLLKDILQAFEIRD